MRNCSCAARHRRLEIRRGLQDPARAVVVRHVSGQQSVAVGGEPLELGRELHPGVLSRAPLVERAARPRGRGQPGLRHQPGESRIEAERVEHPGRTRVRSQHVPLEAHPVHGVADGCLGAGQVRVRLVVGAADEFRAAVAEQLPQLGPVLRERVEVRLEVVDLGEHELVVGVPPRLLHVQPDEVERGPRVGQLPVLVREHQPRLGELALRVPPNRVVVEVADHPHRPAGLGHGELRGVLDPPGGGLEDDGGCADRAGSAGDGDGHFIGAAFTWSCPGYPERDRGVYRWSRDPQCRWRAVVGWVGAFDGDPDDLQRVAGAALE